MHRLWIADRLTFAERAIAARRLAAARPVVAALVGVAVPEAFWELCRDELSRVDVATSGWDIRARWFGVVICATPRLGELDPLAAWWQSALVACSGRRFVGRGGLALRRDLPDGSSSWVRLPAGAGPTGNPLEAWTLTVSGFV